MVFPDAMDLGNGTTTGGGAALEMGALNQYQDETLKQPSSGQQPSPQHQHQQPLHEEERQQQFHRQEKVNDDNDYSFLGGMVRRSVQQLTPKMILQKKFGDDTKKDGYQSIPNVEDYAASATVVRESESFNDDEISSSEISSSCSWKVQMEELPDPTTARLVRVETLSIDDFTNYAAESTVEPSISTSSLSFPFHSSPFSSAFVASWKDYFFPPHLPKEVQLMRWENLAIPGCYLLVGTMQGMFRPLLNVYPLDLGATEAQQTTIATIATLPAAFKILYGFLSDNLPVFGLRRKPYMLAGWISCSLLTSYLWWTYDLTLSYDPETNRAIPPRSSADGTGAPSVQFLSIIFFLFGISLWFADVMADSLVAEKARLEPPDCRGHLQSNCYACRFFAAMLSVPTATFLYSSPPSPATATASFAPEYNFTVSSSSPSSYDVDASSFDASILQQQRQQFGGGGGPGSIILVLMIAPLLLLPFIWMLREDPPSHIKPTSEQCAEIWSTVCTRSVWQPMAFLFSYNVLQVPNAAWRQFLKSVYLFTAQQLNSLLIVAYAMIYVAIMIYKSCFLHTSWRRLYFIGICFNGIASLLQLLLIRGTVPFGLSPFWFALGDDAISDFVTGLCFLPMCILMVHLVPKGSEGASYAMYTTVWNNALLLAPAIGSMLLPIWDVSQEALEKGDLDGMMKLTILTTILQVSPLLFLSWLPNGRDDLLALGGRTSVADCDNQNQIMDEKEGRSDDGFVDEAIIQDIHGSSNNNNGSSKLGGGIFLTVLFGSMLYTLTVTILNLVDPGWAGES